MYLAAFCLCLLTVWKAAFGTPHEEDGSSRLLNKGRPCFVQCGRMGGNCAFCGTGQCCRKTDFNNGVKGCELAGDVTGSQCGNFEFVDSHLVLMNEGRPCWGQCDATAGNCSFCGIGQCCRRVDAEHCVPGCERASTSTLEPVCGNFALAGGCIPSQANPDAAPPAIPVATPAGAPDETGLTNAGRSCYSQCGFNGGNCSSYCGSGQCCAYDDWYRGVPGCELAQNVTQAVCGHFSQPHPEPAEFRLPPPLGTAHTPANPVPSTLVSQRIMDIVATAQDNAIPEYSGDGGKPWSPYEMAEVRDLILREIRQATAGRDEISSAKMLRLAFHDCLRYADGQGGCDGCLNWDKVGEEFGGENGRVEDRELDDHERQPSNNGLQHAVEFLEYIYNLDFGVATTCWMTPATVVGADPIEDTQQNPILVQSTEECQRACQNAPGCVYFTVPTLRFIDQSGPCRLFADTERAMVNPLSTGRLLSGNLTCLQDTQQWSLKSRGKSRADLWAFAALVAVEEGIQRQNWACDGDRRGPHNGPIMCTQFEGEPSCKISPQRSLIFKSGRKDCETNLHPPYKSEKKEIQPDDHFNGTMTLRFMEEHFGFSGRETVAIMGAHTLGRFNQRQTGHKYVWTTDYQAFNNQYYRNIAGRDDWFFDDQECTRVGDAWGNKGKAVWIAKMNQVFRTGGPIQWIQKKVVCPNCAAKSYERGGRHPERLALDRDCCLNNVPDGAQCRPDGQGERGSKAADRDDDFSWGCEYSHFIFGRDEAALGSDMGLMYKFDVDQRGFPNGCPGLQTFYPSSMRFSDWTCGIDGRPWLDDPNRTQNEWTDRACPADCPKQNYMYHDDHRTLADHVERFADDQAAWIDDFFPAMERMIANTYEDEDLVVSWPVDQGSSRRLLADRVHHTHESDIMRGGEPSSTIFL